MYQGDEIMELDGDLYDWCQGCGNNPYFYTPYTNASVETWNQPAETLLSQMNATLLRYPGGSWAESYHWADGVGPLLSRGEEHGYPVLFGTQEYLELCEALGAEPQIIVNVLTGGTATQTGPEEAAAWVHYVNQTGLTSTKTGKPLPTATYWEIGNEDYSFMSAGAYAQAAAAYIVAMKAVDPTIKVGIPLYTPTDWSTQVVQSLASAGVVPDFAISHEGYSVGCNTVPGVSYSDLDLYLAAMTYVPTFDDQTFSTVPNHGNLSMRPLLDTSFPGTKIPIALTEFAFYPILGNFTTGQGIDIGTLTNALYVADLLGHVAQRSDILLANELTSVGPYAGAVSQGGSPNPVYYALQNFGAMQRADTVTPLTITAGETVSLSSSSTVANNCSVWVSGDAGAVPAVSGYATRGGEVVQLMLINKSATDAANIGVEVAGERNDVTSLNVMYSLLTSAGYFDMPVQPAVGTFTSGPSILYQLPAHSLVFLTFSL